MITFKETNDGVRISCVNYYKNHPSLLLVLDGYEELLKEYRDLFREFRVKQDVYEYNGVMRGFLKENEPRDIRRLPKTYLSDILKLDEDFYHYHERFGNKDVPHYQFFIKTVKFSKGVAHIGYVKVGSYMVCCCCKKSREAALKVCHEKFNEYKWVN